MTDQNDNDIALFAKLAELLCSKLCHDLISPIGAINNGLEFLKDDDTGMAEDAAMLIGGSANQAAQKLAYFRLAFGTGGSGDSVEFSAVQKLIEELAQEKKLALTWGDGNQPFSGAIEKNFGKILLNLALLAVDCLPRGGQVSIEMPNFPQDSEVLISATGEKCHLRDDIRSGLDPNIKPENLTVRNVIGFNCNILAKNDRKSLILREESPHVIKFTVSS